MAQRIHKIVLQVVFINADRNERSRPLLQLHMLIERTTGSEPILWWHAVGANCYILNKHNFSTKINDVFRRLNELPEYRNNVT